MSWINLPIICVVFAIGAFTGVWLGFWATYGIQCAAAYIRGYRHGANEVKEREDR